MQKIEIANLTLTLNGNAAAAMEVADEPNTDFVSSPIHVLQMLRHPRWLIPVLLAFVRDKSQRPDDLDAFAEELMPADLQIGMEAARDEILGFFHGEELTYLRTAIAKEEEFREARRTKALIEMDQDIADLDKEADEATAAEIGKQSGNSPDSSESTPETKPAEATPSET